MLQYFDNSELALQGAADNMVDLGTSHCFITDVGACHSVATRQNAAASLTQQNQAMQPLSIWWLNFTIILTMMAMIAPFLTLNPYVTVNNHFTEGNSVITNN